MEIIKEENYQNGNDNLLAKLSQREKTAIIGLQEMIQKNEATAFYKNAYCHVCPSWKSCELLW
jgi:hypothetical protein